MPLRKVDGIPEGAPRKIPQTKQILADVLEAIDKKIEKFELIGDGYNYKTLPNTARQVIKEDVIMRHIIRPAVKKAYKEIMAVGNETQKEEMYGKYSVSYSLYDSDKTFKYKNEWIAVRRVSEADRVHTYVEIDFDILEKLRQEISDYLKPDPSYIPKDERARTDSKKPKIRYLMSVLNPARYGADWKTAHELAKLFSKLDENQTNYAVAFAKRLGAISEAKDYAVRMLENGDISKAQYDAISNDIYIELAAEYEDVYDPIDEENKEPRWHELISDKIREKEEKQCL